jgi:glycosyltransferase involved in cell wall biosynthesis
VGNCGDDVEMISIIIASITDDLEALDAIIDSILRPNCPFKCEVIVVTPKDISTSRENVRCIKETNSTGSCEAYNYGLTFATGDYIGITTDDMFFVDRWWDFTNIVDQMGFISFKTGFLNVSVPHVFGFNREFLNGPMKGVIFNPALTHMYLDNDLAFRLDKSGFTILTLTIVQGTIKHKIEGAKNDSKLKSYKLDGMIFNHIWKARHKNLSSLARLYPQSLYSDEELYTKMCELLKKDISGEIYGIPFRPWDEDYLDLRDALLDNISEEESEMLSNNMAIKITSKVLFL